MARTQRRKRTSKGLVNARFAYDLQRAAAVPTEVVAGADEAGRGALAGPLVAAAVAFDYTDWSSVDFAALEALDDSKRIDPETRDALFEEVLARAAQVVCVARSRAAIDGRGLHVCNQEALAEALSRLRLGPCLLLVDGFAPGCTAPPCEVVVGGDGLSAAVAAASIIAKVTRDRLMRRLHESHPSWGFDEHVGYATPLHHAAILEHGLCVLHRRSFRSVAYQQLELGSFLVDPDMEVDDRARDGDGDAALSPGRRGGNARRE